eukprot:214137_1
MTESSESDDNNPTSPSYQFEQNTSKTITTLGSIFLFVNNTIGPGLVLFPAEYQKSGWIPAAVCSILLCIMSYIIGLLLTTSIRTIPHNKYDDLKIEYLDLIKYYMGFHKTISTKNTIIMRLSQTMYILFMIAFLMGALIQTCQTFDLAIARIFGNSYGLIYFPFYSIGFIKGNCIDSISPFNDPNTFILSIGTLIMYICIIPFCMKHLSEAIWIQYVGTYGSIILMCLWIFMLAFSAELDIDNVPVATSSIYNTLSVNFYNIAFLCTFPSWLNEKKEEVKPKKVLKYTSIITAFWFIIIGYFGGIAFYPYYNTNGDMLSKLNHFMPNKYITNDTLITFFRYLGPISCYSYPLLQCLTQIPVFAIIIRYNLINTHILNKEWSANIIAIWIPFLLSIFLYHGNGFNFILNWTGVVFASFVNFILPIFFYYKSMMRPKAEWSVISFSKHHKNLLDRSNVDLKRMLEIEHGIVVSNEIDAKRRFSETDVLLLDVPKTYNSSDNEEVTRGVLMNRARKALYLLTFTICLAVFAFCLDVIAV